MTRTEFLLARIAEDEHFGTHDRAMQARLDRECAFKRAVVAYFEDYDAPVIDALVAVYSDHPDCQPEWQSGVVERPLSRMSPNDNTEAGARAEAERLEREQVDLVAMVDDANREAAAQRAKWEAFTASRHAKGLCEFSGLRVTRCVGSICDCFETPEGAAEIERLASESTPGSD